MKLIFAFLPLIAFLVCQRFLGPSLALAVAAVVALGATATNVFIRRSGLKTLDVGSMVLFGVLAIYVGLSTAPLTFAQIRLFVDTGLFVIVLISILIRRPFTLEYVSPDRRRDAHLIHAHTIVSAIWLAAFAAMDVMDMVWIRDPSLPPDRLILFSIGIVIVAWRGSQRYVSALRAKASNSAPS